MTTRLDRRSLLAAAALLPLGGGARAQTAPPAGGDAPAAPPAPEAAPARPEKPRTRLVLLGTKGGPRVGGTRSNPANALVVDGRPFIVDCGYGVTRQMIAAGIPLSALRTIFISHHHSDHNLEYGNLYYNAWVAGLTRKVQSFGPPGMEALTRDFFRLNHIDIETRMEDEGRKDPRELLIAKDIADDGPVMQTQTVKVTAMKTPHPPMTDLAFRFETPDGVVVFTGDTAYNPALAEFAKGADILVHEALYLPGVDRLVAAVPNAETLRKHLIDSHTSTQDVGRIAAAAGVKLLVLSHLVPGDQPITDEEWLAGVRETYTGPAVVGRDLMEFALPL